MSDKNSTLLKKVICPYCNLVMSCPYREPTILTNCGHTICIKCKNLFPFCPICSQKIIKTYKNQSITALLETIRKTSSIPPNLDPIEIVCPLQIARNTTGQPSEIGPFCSFPIYGELFINQKIYCCRTCELVEPHGCCEACALRCHAGHDVYQSAKPIGSYCDCGADTLKTGKCCSCTARHETCSYKSKGRNFIAQKFFNCLTCELVPPLGCCEVCARNCHYGHELVFQSVTMSYCDCPEKCKCICQS